MPDAVPSKRSRMHESVDNAIDLYTPQPSLCPHFAEYATACQDAVRKAAPSTSQSALNMLIPLTQFMEWCRQEGLPPDLKATLRPEHVDRYGRFGMPRLSVKGRATRVGALRRVGRAAAPKWWASKAPLFPSVDKRQRQRQRYTREEVAAYWTAAEHQSTAAKRRYFRATLALGLGAGLRASEMVLASPSDLLYDEGVLCIEPPSNTPTTRVVPIRRECVDVLLDLAAATPNEQFAYKAPLLHSDPLARMRDYIEVPAHLPQLSGRRLRDTWLLALLDDRLDMATLTQIAGSLDIRIIEGLLSSITPTSRQRAWAIATGSDTVG